MSELLQGYLQDQVAILQKILREREQRIEDLEAQAELDREERDRYAREVRRLEAGVAELRQPCPCQPPRSGPACNGTCRVRVNLEAFMVAQRTSLAPWQQAFVLAAFDAAVQAVREGQE